MNWKAGLLSAALGGILLFGGAAATQARDRDDKCFERMRREEQKLDRDINRHGFNSRQAQHDREKLREARDRCRGESNRRWRNGDGDRDGRWGRDRHRDRDDRWHRDQDHDRDNN